MDMGIILIGIVLFIVIITITMIIIITTTIGIIIEIIIMHLEGQWPLEQELVVIDQQ